MLSHVKPCHCFACQQPCLSKCLVRSSSCRSLNNMLDTLGQHQMYYLQFMMHISIVTSSLCKKLMHHVKKSLLHILHWCHTACLHQVLLNSMRMCQIYCQTNGTYFSYGHFFLCVFLRKVQKTHDQAIYQDHNVYIILFCLESLPQSHIQNMLCASSTTT